VKQKYALGFIFDQAGDHVLLINKMRPAWQCGKLNGIGGKVEEGETFLQAMIRECWEETGIATEARGLEWQHFATLIGVDYHVEIFALFSQVVFYALQRTDEALQILPHRDLPESRIMPNLPVLIALALDESGITKPVLLHDGLAPPLSEWSAKWEAELRAAWESWAKQASAQVDAFLAANPDNYRAGEFTVTVPFPVSNNG
jgi:8-oxo-dGTP diphosphatase